MTTTLSPLEIIRAWKDEEYRQRLTQAQLAQLPQHPAGMIELTDAELDGVVGRGKGTNYSCFGCSVPFRNEVNSLLPD